jgi:hypothetical protein
MSTPNLQLSTANTIEFGLIAEPWKLEVGNWVLSDGFFHHPARDGANGRRPR